MPCTTSTPAHLLGYALRLTNGDRHRAEDVVQETLLRAWRHPEAIHRSPEAVRPWLFTVAATSRSTPTALAKQGHRRPVPTVWR